MVKTLECILTWWAVCFWFKKKIIIPNIWATAKKKVPRTNSARNVRACETDFLPSGEPVNSCPVKLQVASSLSSAGERGHDDHQLGKTRSVAIRQHVRRHRDERVEEDRAHALAHLAVVTHNVSGEQLQKLPVLLHHFKLLRVLWRSGCHASQPGLQTRGLHTGQLGQGAAQAQQAGVWALFSCVYRKHYCEVEAKLSWHFLMQRRGFVFCFFPYLYCFLAW